jgi:hypothetical protein
MEGLTMAPRTSDINHAKITVFRESKKEEIEVMFNPSDYVVESSNKYAWIQIPGLQSPVGQYISGESQTLKVNLFFDTYTNEKAEKEDVRKYTKKIYGLLNVDGGLHAPPLCQFSWGTFNFKGVVESVSQQFTMFIKTGIPVRATLSVSMRSFLPVKEQLKNPPRESPDRTKHRMLNQNDQLWMLASKEYNDPGMWREIARANNIDNPRLLETGGYIKVPAIE